VVEEKVRCGEWFPGEHQKGHLITQKFYINCPSGSRAQEANANTGSSGKWPLYWHVCVSACECMSVLTISSLFMLFIVYFAGFCSVMQIDLGLYFVLIEPPAPALLF